MTKNPKVPLEIDFPFKELENILLKLLRYFCTIQTQKLGGFLLIRSRPNFFLIKLCFKCLFKVKLV